MLSTQWQSADVVDAVAECRRSGRVSTQWQSVDAEAER
jgi:hypothetical protein